MIVTRPICPTRLIHLLAFVALCMPLGLAKAADDHRPYIAVSGTGRVATAPDIATITIGCTTTAKAATQAVSENNTKTRSILDSLGKFKIAGRDVQTSGFNLSPDYRYDQASQRQVQTGFQASNNVTIRIRELDKVGVILDALVKAGANNVNGISFSNEKYEPLLEKARAAAVVDATRKAQEYAKAADVKLGSVVSIDEATDGQAPYNLRAEKSMMADAAAAPSEVPVAGGELEYKVDVNVKFKIDE